MVFARLFEQRNQPLNFANGIFVNLGRICRAIEKGVDQNYDGLRHAVENQQLVGDEKNHRGRMQFVLGWTRHNRFNIMNEFVTDETDRAASETRQTRQQDRAIFFHHALDDFEAIANRCWSAGLRPGALGMGKR